MERETKERKARKKHEQESDRFKGPKKGPMCKKYKPGRKKHARRKQKKPESKSSAAQGRKSWKMAKGTTDAAKRCDRQIQKASFLGTSTGLIPGGVSEPTSRDGEL